MNRRAAFALFAVSLTLLPACVTKVVVEAPTTTEGVTTTTLPKRELRVSKLEEFRESLYWAMTEFREELSVSEKEKSRLSDDRFTKPGEPTIALEACERFDEGWNFGRWYQSFGLEPDANYFVDSNYLTLLGTHAVLVLCPEHMPLLESQ